MRMFFRINGESHELEEPTSIEMLDTVIVEGTKYSIVGVDREFKKSGHNLFETDYIYLEKL